MIFDLPTTLSVKGVEYAINTDYRDVLRTLTAFEDPDLSDEEKAYIVLHNTYVDMAAIPRDKLQEALDAALRFIDLGKDPDEVNGPRTMDWTQDAPLIFPAVNRAAGMEVRSVAYMHWWTFMGFFMEIRDTTYATVLGLRGKKARGKKLEKDDQDFWRHNKALCELKKKYNEAELAEQDAMNRLLGF